MKRDCNSSVYLTKRIDTICYRIKLFLPSCFYGVSFRLAVAVKLVLPCSYRQAATILLLQPSCSIYLIRNHVMDSGFKWTLNSTWKNTKPFIKTLNNYNVYREYLQFKILLRRLPHSLRIDLV